MNKNPLCHIGCGKGGIVLEGIYDIFRGGEKIGKAEVLREGLYYRFRCCCQLTGNVIYRITISCDGQSENLGIPVPEADAFYLTKRIPVSRFPSGTPQFSAIPSDAEKNGMWIPVVPEEPFAYIERLEHAVMEHRNGQMGILIPEEADPIPQDSDQNL